MRNAARYLVFVGLLLILESCYTFETRTARDETYEEVLQKVGVVVEAGHVVIVAGGNVDRKAPSKYVRLGDYMSKNLEIQFSNLGIPAKGFSNNGTELDDSQLGLALQEYDPRQILTVKLAEGTVIVGDVLHSGTFVATLSDLALQRNVWKATVDLRNASQFPAVADTIDRLVKAIIDSMRKDRLVAELKPA